MPSTPRRLLKGAAYHLEELARCERAILDASRGLDAFARTLALDSARELLTHIAECHGSTSHIAPRHQLADLTKERIRRATLHT